MVAPNFSIGVAMLRRLVAQAAALLTPFPEFEPAIIERHHSAKKDAPSGTATMLARVVREHRGDGEVPVAAVRQGGQPGEHTVIFDGAAESLTIAHQARSRLIFATGAVRAAEWIVQERPHGLVTFDTFLERIGTWQQD
jgi:4-hydroxy-tetrahydrodipicolinate reductase